MKNDFWCQTSFPIFGLRKNKLRDKWRLMQCPTILSGNSIFQRSLRSFFLKTLCWKCLLMLTNLKATFVHRCPGGDAEGCSWRSSCQGEGAGSCLWGLMQSWDRLHSFLCFNNTYILIYFYLYVICLGIIVCFICGMVRLFIAFFLLRSIHTVNQTSNFFKRQRRLLCSIGIVLKC